MLILKKFHQFFSTIRQERKIVKLRGKPTKSVAEFKKKYPNYKIGTPCYGLPIIRYQHKNATLRIGSYCSIAKNVQIFIGGMHRKDWITTYPFPAFEPIAQHIKNYSATNGNVAVGSDVWLCENSTILSGVSIGHGAIIANGAMVTKDVPPYAIVGGNPAKLIRWRFDEPTRNALLDIAWWDWPEDEVLSVVDQLCSENIADFLEYAKQRKS